jgi:hypothetical protein
MLKCVMRQPASQQASPGRTPFSKIQESDLLARESTVFTKTQKLNHRQSTGQLVTEKEAIVCKYAIKYHKAY